MGCGIGLFGGGASQALDYVPQFSSGAGDIVTVSLTEGGATGTLSIVDALDSDAGLTSIKVRPSADRSTAYVSIGGGSEFALVAELGPLTPVGVSTETPKTQTAPF